MTVEIERKFLVNSNDFKKEASKSYSIKQGFLNSHEERTVRVRLKNDKGYLTIKGKSSEDGLVRFEWETEITKFEAEQLLTLCEDSIIDKIRYEVNFGNHTFEIDEFFGENDGLVIAEVELQSKNEDFNKPDWLGKEVTGDIRYYNSQLSKQPYKNWK
ncbi:MAG: adenylate cyclase [Flavobacteriaceae bacterium]|uniref:CYTH domain-containing protein n=1 Tax=Winogradskyella poriferorum TaxID=307627 RepID=UPI000C4B2CF7|nr:adenylate cyclase [Flavobacteriaceae bacterium]MBD10365.1 adenylate cyclase [Flavobacteriaceae bacterium]|tara:strand:+ start:40530 stop:41003 length:474 start_codon:yes stop_codon:yes gene_type:complete